MKPGDLIEWIYKSNSKVVNLNENLWSSLMKQWVPIGEKSLLISITDVEYVWLCSKGLFRAHVDDAQEGPHGNGEVAVVPRASG